MGSAFPALALPAPSFHRILRASSRAGTAQRPPSSPKRAPHTISIPGCCATAWGRGSLSPSSHSSPRIIESHF